MSDTPDPRLEALIARVGRLESEVAELRRGAVTPGRLQALQSQPPPPSPDAVAAAAPKPSPAPRPKMALDSEAILKWVGVALVVLAVGFAVSTAISRGWIGAEVQLAGAVALSIALIVVGLRLREHRMPWTHALCSGGIAALFTTFASDLFIDETNTDTAFVAIAAVAVVGYGVARFAPSEWAGVVTVVGALAGWFVVGDGEPPFASTLALVTAVAAIAVVMSIERGWFGLRLLGHATALVMIFGLAFEADSGGRQVAVVVAVVATFLSFVRIPSVGSGDDAWLEVEIQLAMVAPPWAVACLVRTFDIDDGIELGAVALAVAAVTAGLAIALEPRLRPAHLLSHFVGTSVAVTIALAAVLDTEPAFVALAVQGAGLLALGRRFGNPLRLLINAGILLFVAAMFALIGGIEAWSDDASVGGDLSNLAVIIVLAVASWQTGLLLVRQWVGAAVLGLSLVWLGSVLVHLPEGQAAVSVSWAVVGIGLLVVGAVRKLPELGGSGLAVLALTVGKLLLVDMREVDALWRAGLFLLVGLGLLRLGFLLPGLTGGDDGRTRAEARPDEVTT